MAGFEGTAATGFFTSTRTFGGEGHLSGRLLEFGGGPAAKSFFRCSCNFSFIVGGFTVLVICHSCLIHTFSSAGSEGSITGPGSSFIPY